MKANKMMATINLRLAIEIASDVVNVMSNSAFLAQQNLNDVGRMCQKAKEKRALSLRCAK